MQRRDTKRKIQRIANENLSIARYNAAKICYRALHSRVKD